MQRWSRTVRRGGRKSRQGLDQEVWKPEEEPGLHPLKGSGSHLERSLWMQRRGQCGQTGSCVIGQGITAMSRRERAEVGCGNGLGRGDDMRRELCRI